MGLLQVISPINNEVIIERPYAVPGAVNQALDRAKQAFQEWRKVPLEKRAEYCRAWVERFSANADIYGQDLTRQMGRPLKDAVREAASIKSQIDPLIDIAFEALKDVTTPSRPGLHNFIKRVPLGVVVCIAPWNYPYFTAFNSIMAAVMAGNTVILKHSEQTPLCGDHILAAAQAAELPTGVFQSLILTHEDTERLVKHSDVQGVTFTGSVRGGQRIKKSLADRFIPVDLELGGKDPAYVRSDADLDLTVPALVDGAFSNAGQSCCAIERIYVAKPILKPFLEKFVSMTQSYVLGDPLQATTTLGPMVRVGAADFVRGQIKAAVKAGATSLINPDLFPAHAEGTAYQAPQVVIDVNHQMSLMRDESFGPVVGIMAVEGDDEAIQLMNDSDYGLTASIWTQDLPTALKLGEDIVTGTWFLNRCDAVDPYLAWTGAKNSGDGCSLSRIGYERLTRPQSYHLRLP